MSKFFLEVKRFLVDAFMMLDNFVNSCVLIGIATFNLRDARREHNREMFVVSTDLVVVMCPTCYDRYQRLEYGGSLEGLWMHTCTELFTERLKVSAQCETCGLEQDEVEDLVRPNKGEQCIPSLS